MDEIHRWASELDALMKQIGKRFARSEARMRAKSYLIGLLSPAERKNGWQLAEMMGDTTPYAFQQFLYRSPWDPDDLRDDLRNYVVQHLADADAVLVLDETGFLKKGTKSAGVARQYSGTAGRIENCQIGVFLAYASSHGTAFIDRWLYLPESWTQDPERCEAAGISEAEGFATKPQMALTMLKRAFAANVPFAWISGDCVYGDYRVLRLWLETLPRGYVLAVSGKETVTKDGKTHRVSSVLKNPSAEGWQRLSADDGAKGPQMYDWVRIPLQEPLQEGWSRWLLLRRSISDPSDIVAYVCFAPSDTPLEVLVGVAGRRWTIEACFEAAKGEVGLDHFEVRSWLGWYRHITLACLAHAFLTVMRAQTGTLSVDLQEGGPASRPNSLSSFKVQRGLLSV